MGLLAKLFGKSESTATVERTSEEVSATCPHVTLLPKWDSVADMGNEDKVTTYTCEGCGQSFTAEEGRALRQSEADRIQSGMSIEPEPEP